MKEPCGVTMKCNYWPIVDKAMEEQLLQYQSPEQFMRVPNPSSPTFADTDGWTVKEVISEPGPHVEKGVISYRLLLEHQVGTSDDLTHLYWAAHRLADELSTAWCILCGWPFEECGKGSACNANPAGWCSNYDAVSVAIQRKESQWVIEAAQTWSYRCVTFPFMPLIPLLDARARIQAASPTLREIALLYRQSREAEDLMLLSKALEVVGWHYGKLRDVRNAGVQGFLDSYFETGRISKRADWLFDIANTRFETRHAVENQSNVPTLTQRLTSEDKTEFASNAGRAVRGFLCHQLGIQMVFSRHR